MPLHARLYTAKSFVFVLRHWLRAMTGVVFSFLAGFIALRWHPHWLERFRWYLFGACYLRAAAVVLCVG